MFGLMLVLFGCAAFNRGLASDLSNSDGYRSGIVRLAGQMQMAGVNIGFLAIAAFAAFLIYNTLKTGDDNVLLIADTSGLRFHDGEGDPDFAWPEIADVTLDRQLDALTLLVELRNGERVTIDEVDRDEDVRQAFLRLAASRLGGPTPPS